MSSAQTTTSIPASPADKLERQLSKLLAAGKRRRKNENIVDRSKNGDLTYESVRTETLPVNHHAASTPKIANFYPETPVSAKNGQQFGASDDASNSVSDPTTQPEAVARAPLAAAASTDKLTATNLTPAAISIHETPASGQKIPADDPESADPLEELLARALSRPRRGRPSAFDEHKKGQLVALLSLGMSLRQAASVLGVTHGTIRNTLKADPTLAEEITAARFQAQLQPLACVIREARRSWKAATWLLKYLDGKIASHEETPDERRQRQQQETDEFFDHAHARHAKPRHTVG